jgi:hypothetical protein
MNITFDVISDLHLDSLDNFSWEGKSTSLFCIVAGNISAKRDVLFEFLDEIKDYYEGVFFVDGELEHEEYKDDFETSYRNLEEGIELIDRVVFMHENIVVLNGVTLVATNGWTTFDFSSQAGINANIQFLDERGLVREEHANEIFKMAITDQHYMYNSIQTCQTLEDCENIIVITNTVPIPDLINHKDDYDGTILGDVTGSTGLNDCLTTDRQKKVKTWVFGKFVDELDFNVGNIRYVSNPGKGRSLDTYYPKRISAKD